MADGVDQSETLCLIARQRSHAAFGVVVNDDAFHDLHSPD